METKTHPNRQVNKARLESERIANINRVIKKLNSISDSLYESLCDKERGYSLSSCNKLAELSEEIKSNIEKFIIDEER